MEVPMALEQSSLEISLEIEFPASCVWEVCVLRHAAPGCISIRFMSYPSLECLFAPETISYAWTGAANIMQDSSDGGCLRARVRSAWLPPD